MIENSSLNALIDLMGKREAMYGLLARLYREEVDQDLLTQLQSIEITADEGDPELTAGYVRLKAAIDGLGADPITDLAVDYAKVFLGFGPVQGEGAFPYESVYTSLKGLLMQEARDEVVAIYESEGLEPSQQFNEPEDHLAFELTFMVFLCQKIVAALKRGEENEATAALAKQQEFLQGHLLRWVPRFCSDVQRIAGQEFYRAVAQITEHYLAMEQELIAEMLS